MSSNTEFLITNLEPFGTCNQTLATIKRIQEKKSWEDFKDKYPHGQAIPPYSIEKIVKEYYKKYPPATTTSPSDTPTSPPATTTTSDNNGLPKYQTEIRRTGVYSPFLEQNALEEWYIYNDEQGNLVESRTKPNFKPTSKAGKRKSRRNRKSKKSRKNLRKSNRRR